MAFYLGLGNWWIFYPDKLSRLHNHTTAKSRRKVRGVPAGSHHASARWKTRLLEDIAVDPDLRQRAVGEVPASFFPPIIFSQVLAFFGAVISKCFVPVQF